MSSVHSGMDPVFIGENNKELIEVYTSEGKATGVAKNRKLIHELGDFHHTVQCWVINKYGEMILQQRSPYKKFYPSHWDVSTAGHMSFGETSREACVKELGEELGLETTAANLELIIDKIQMSHILHNNTYIDNEFVDVYVLYLPEFHDVGVLKLQEAEVSNAKLVHYELIEQWMKSGQNQLVPIKVQQYYQIFDYFRSNPAKYGTFKDLVQAKPNNHVTQL